MAAAAAAAAGGLRAVEWEVCGRVQGVFFRKYTQLKAKELGVVGWCRNTESGTVKGEAQGSASAVEHFKYWVENEGSPHSYISNCIFRRERVVEALDYPDFSVRR